MLDVRVKWIDVSEHHATLYRHSRYLDCTHSSRFLWNVGAGLL